LSKFNIARSQMERKKLNLPATKEANVLGKRKADQDDASQRKEGEETKTATNVPPRKKKAKGPNPLSMRKPKKVKGETSSSSRKSKAN
jgi:hypothetical protein